MKRKQRSGAMKASIKQASDKQASDKFEPFTLEIEVETEEDARDIHAALSGGYGQSYYAFDVLDDHLRI